jgi:DNA repair exonuclease SbcCD ATPase subunit
MRRSENMNLYVNRQVAKAFREAAHRYDDRIGLCASASFLMFLEADPKVQGEYLNRIFQLDLGDQVEEMLKAVKEEQSRRVAQRERETKLEPKRHRKL